MGLFFTSGRTKHLLFLNYLRLLTGHFSSFSKQWHNCLCVSQSSQFWVICKLAAVPLSKWLKMLNRPTVNPCGTPLHWCILIGLQLDCCQWQSFETGCSTGSQSIPQSTFLAHASPVCQWGCYRQGCQKAWKGHNKQHLLFSLHLPNVISFQWAIRLITNDFLFKNPHWIHHKEQHIN